MSEKEMQEIDANDQSTEAFPITLEELNLLLIMCSRALMVIEDEFGRDYSMEQEFIEKIKKRARKYGG